ncbi:MAG: pyridoxamine 5'-phosphate oxidase [Bacteroidia bacterium]|nr:pyridoxamine 5'-phosphate oxidase [Bacteroidia bacterium]
MSKTSAHLQQLRTDYGKASLDLDSISGNPFVQFTTWMDQAIAVEVHEANAMSLATVDSEGKPSVRIVLVRGFDERGFVFFTNYNSRKGDQIAQNPHGAVCFFWPELERQIRIEGIISKTTPAESDAYFLTRPPGNRLGAWASPQSQEIADRKVLEDLVTHWESHFEGIEIHRPENWGGYRLAPTRMEFWQGRPSRLHDRICYTQQPDGAWKIVRLAP